MGKAAFVRPERVSAPQPARAEAGRPVAQALIEFTKAQNEQQKKA